MPVPSHGRKFHCFETQSPGTPGSPVSVPGSLGSRRRLRPPRRWRCSWEPRTRTAGLSRSAAGRRPDADPGGELRGARRAPPRELDDQLVGDEFPCRPTRVAAAAGDPTAAQAASRASNRAIAERLVISAVLAFSLLSSEHSANTGGRRSCCSPILPETMRQRRVHGERRTIHGDGDRPCPARRPSTATSRSARWSRATASRSRRPATSASCAATRPPTPSCSRSVRPPRPSAAGACRRRPST